MEVWDLVRLLHMAQGKASDPKAEAERREKIAASRRGKSHSPETVEKIAASAFFSQRERREREAEERLERLLSGDMTPEEKKREIDREYGGDPWLLPEHVRRKKFPGEDRG